MLSESKQTVFLRLVPAASVGNKDGSTQTANMCVANTILTQPQNPFTMRRPSSDMARPSSHVRWHVHQAMWGGQARLSDCHDVPCPAGTFRDMLGHVLPTHPRLRPPTHIH